MDEILVACVQLPRECGIATAQMDDQAALESRLFQDAGRIILSEGRRGQKDARKKHRPRFQKDTSHREREPSFAHAQKLPGYVERGRIDGRISVGGFTRNSQVPGTETVRLLWDDERRVHRQSRLTEH